MLVATATDSFVQVPALRWSVPEDAPANTHYGAFMTGEELFDCARFGVAPSEAATMDPQQRRLLEVGYEALHASGFTRASLMETTVGNFVGIMSVEFSAACEHSNSYSLTGTGHCFASGRLSYVLGLQGECVTVDTACSSALVAANSACLSVRTGRMSDGIISGINMMFLPAMAAAYAAASLTSASGSSMVFDARADGFVRGEGCATGVVRSGAEAASCLVAGTAVCQDGKSASLTAPNGGAQQRLMSTVLADTASMLGGAVLLESASTGSQLGDPIEVGAIIRAVVPAFGAAVVGGIKANVGHTESASGSIGLAKLLASLRRAVAPPNAQLRALGQNVRAAVEGGKQACWLPTQLTNLDAVEGMVNSFGLGGTIASAALRVVPAGPIAAAAPTYRLRRRSFPWRKPLRLHVASRGAIADLVLCEQPPYQTPLRNDEVEV